MSYLKPRQPYFSSPGLFTCLGQACGTATDDAVRTFNQTSPAVAAAMDADVRLNGIYWDPNASGTGWTVDLSKGKVIATAFVYDDTGNPTWITGLGTPCAAKPASYCIALNEYQGGQTLTGAYRASQFKRKVTDAELTFSEGYPAALQVQLGGVSKQFQRYVFDPASAFMAKPMSPGAPLVAVMPATYWNAAAPGTGIFMERQGETVVATAFYYRPDGSAAWSTVAGANFKGTSATGYTLNKLAFTTYANGQTLTGNYRVPVLTNASEATTYLDLEAGLFTVLGATATRLNERWSRFVF